FVDRSDAGPAQRIPVDLHRLLVEKDETQNIPIQNGDVVVLPVFEDKVYVVGEVKTPGAQDFRPDLTPREYLAAAGGPSARAMVTGEYGCGKTTLSRALIQRLEAERYEIGLLTNPSWNATDFLREALYQLGVESKEKSKSELLHLLNDVFFRNYRDGRDTVII